MAYQSFSRFQDPASPSYLNPVVAKDNSKSIESLVFGGYPGEDQFYSGQIARAQRSLGAQSQGLRSAALQNLEARGLGQSSEVRSTLTGLADLQSQRLQDVIGDVGAQQFSARQQRINAYLSYLYQKKLQKGGGTSPLDFLAQLAAAGGNLYANRNQGGDPYAVTDVRPIEQNYGT